MPGKGVSLSAVHRRRISDAHLAKPQPETKVCYKCKRDLPATAFYVRSRTKRTLSGQCKECSLAESKRRRQALTEEQRREDYDRQRSNALRRKYGITTSEFDAMLLAQGGVCAICRRTSRGHARTVHLFIDHDHETGEVRSLLCGSCNTLIGHAYEDAGILQAAIDYLNLHADTRRNPPTRAGV